MTVLQRESTEYVYLAVTGDTPSQSTEVAFLEAGLRPDTGDWHDAELVEDDTHPLWDDANSAGISGDFFLARLIGGFGGNDVTLDPGDYQVWVRLTDVDEQVVRIAPVALEIA